MSSTGRLEHPVNPTAQRLLFGGAIDPQDPVTAATLRHHSTVDLAHVLMLAEGKIVDEEAARHLVACVCNLRADGFSDLEGRPAPRGLYLAYESFLCERLGSDVGGILHTGRSRNDLHVTALLLRLRESYERLVGEALRLGITMLRRGERYRRLVMPAYTHYQPAVPITYGHYLCGATLALCRNAGALLDAGRELDESPLGAGAIGGTTIPIDVGRTARLLGFASTTANSVAAIASRDVVLRLLADSAVLGVLLGRVAHDLLLWSTQEFGFLRLPDDLVGSSSMMPQKRNPFLLEHVQGRGGALLGAFVEAAAAMHATPFSNSAAVGTEAVRDVEAVLGRAAEAEILLRIVVASAEPDAGAMEQRAADGYTSATAFAERLATAGVPFREAHHTVGAAVRAAVAEGSAPLEEAAKETAAEADVEVAGLEPAAVSTAASYGGGPGAIEASIGATREALRARVRQLRAQVDRWRVAERELDVTVEHFAKGAR
jgi:argininosuccinate lyase